MSDCNCETPCTQVCLTFDYASFIAQIPAYSNPIKYTEAALQQFWNNATGYISTVANYGSLRCQKRQYAINLMTAHLVYLSDLLASGETPYVLTNATIDKITVGVQPPPIKDQFQWWLQTSPYGQAVYALLYANSVGGFYMGGGGALAAFGYQGGNFFDYRGFG